MQHFGISVVVKESIGVDAENYEEAVKVVKEVWLDQHNIELENHEIDPIGPRDLKEVLDLLDANGYQEASNFLQLHYNDNE